MQLREIFHSFRLTIPPGLAKVPIVKLFPYNISV